MCHLIIRSCIVYVKKTYSQLQNQPERWIANTNKLQIINWTHRDIVVRPNWWPMSTCSSLGEPFYYIGVSQYIEDHKPVNYTKEISHRVYTKLVSLCPFYTLWCPRNFPRKFSFTRYSPKKRTKKTMTKMSIFCNWFNTHGLRKKTIYNIYLLKTTLLWTNHIQVVHVILLLMWHNQFSKANTPFHLNCYNR